MRRVLVLVLFFLGTSVAQASCPEGHHKQCVIWCWCARNWDPPDLPKIPPISEIKPDVILTGGMSLVWEEAARQNIPVLSQVAVNMNELTENLESEFKTAIENTLNSHDKAILDAAHNILKSANDVVDGARAMGHYAEREVAGWGRVLTAAEQRLREGKVFDAMWHLTTDQWQERNMNAAQLAQESEVAAAAMKSAAYAYGGPAGAAAFAAWQTYMATDGNVDLALRAGAFSYAISVAGGDVTKMPAASLGEVAKKAAMAGAVGGLAVAASGGSDEEALNAFVRSGGAVLVQAGQDYANENFVEPGQAQLEERYGALRAKVDAYCVTATGEDCETVARWYARSRETVKELESLTQTKPSIVVSLDWAISWDPETIGSPGTNQPSVVMTFIGEGSPVREALTEVAELANPKVDQATQTETAWVAYRGVGDPSGFFFNTRLGADGGSPEVGDELVANRSIYIRTAPADWASEFDTLGVGDTITVLAIETLQVGPNRQEWIKFSLSKLERPAE